MISKVLQNIYLDIFKWFFSSNLPDNFVQALVERLDGSQKRKSESFYLVKYPFIEIVEVFVTGNQYFVQSS